MINDSIIVAYGVVKSAEYHNALIKQFCNSVLEKYEEEFDEFFVLKDFYLKDNLMISATCYKPLRKEYYSILISIKDSDVISMYRIDN